MSTQEDHNQSGLIQQQIAQLIALQHTSRKVQERDALIADIRKLNKGKVLGVLTEMLHDPDGERRCDVAEALMRIDPIAGTPIILPLLKDSLDYVRRHVCGLLHDSGDERAVVPLIDIILHDPEGNVRHIACYALERIGDSRALDALRWVETHDHGTDRHGDPVSRIATEAIAAILDRERGI